MGRPGLVAARDLRELAPNLGCDENYCKREEVVGLCQRESRMKRHTRGISGVLAVLILTACVAIPESPPVLLTSTPIAQPVHTPTTTIEEVDCVMQGSSPAPSLPDTDCMAWGMLHSLVFMTSAMANRDPSLTASELVALETELYPLFVQAHLNCGEWLEPKRDYEPFTDYLGIISVIGMTDYGYDPAALLLYMIEGAATEAFADRSESIGCVKNLFLLFVEYSE